MDENGIKGYKAFYKNLVNQNGMSFEIGKRYVCEEEYQNYGFHFCKNIEDTLRYFDAKDDEVKICKGPCMFAVYNCNFFRLRIKGQSGYDIHLYR